MTYSSKPIWTRIRTWHSLTDIPAGKEPVQPAPSGNVASSSQRPKGPPTSNEPASPILSGLSPVLMKILFDLMVYPYSSTRVRIRRLNTSVRLFEKAKLEGCEKGFMIESSAGATTNLIPLPQTFDALGFLCPYDLAAIEHSYYIGFGGYFLSQDAANKSVHTELTVGSANRASDIVTVGHDGSRCAYEVTLSTGNVLSNAIKYADTAFVQICFLCRDYRLREAVKACCREGGLDPELLARLAFMQFSTLLARQRKLSLY